MMAYDDEHMRAAMEKLMASGAISAEDIEAAHAYALEVGPQLAGRLVGMCGSELDALNILAAAAAKIMVDVEREFVVGELMGLQISREDRVAHLAATVRFFLTRVSVGESRAV